MTAIALKELYESQLPTNKAENVPFCGTGTEKDEEIRRCGKI
jgi:hypothetical protein